MSNSKLPERASLEYLKKLAKDRLQELRQADPHTKLATALLAVARDHGFSSWRALKAELDQRQTKNVALFFDACAKGDVEVLRSLLAYSALTGDGRRSGSLDVGSKVGREGLVMLEIPSIDGLSFAFGSAG
jgi:Glyoxalase superfamily protein